MSHHQIDEEQAKSEDYKEDDDIPRVLLSTSISDMTSYRLNLIRGKAIESKDIQVFGFLYQSDQRIMLGLDYT